MLNLPKVDVVLCTYNGDQFIGEFLETLSRQKGVELNLYIFDDLSDDRTCEIAASFASEFASFKLVVNQERLGPKKNFIQAIKDTKSPFVAFADQDDKWDEEKLKKLTDQFNRAKVVAAYSHFTTNSGKYYRIDHGDIETALWSNQIPGCTMMINREVISILSQVNVNKVIMHDWAALIIALAIGKIGKVEEALVEYRQHSNNVVGIPSLFQRILRVVLIILRLKQPADLYSQMKEMRRVLNEIQNKKVLLFLDKCVSIRERSFLQRMSFCFEYFVLKNTKSNWKIMMRIITKTF